MTLRIVIWNCNMALHKKVEPLMALRPDIAVVSECANPEIVQKKASRFEFSDASWIGRSPHKGLGVFTFGRQSVTASPIFDPQFEFFLPVKIYGKHNFNLLAVWAFNHRTKVPAYRNGAGTLSAIRYYQEFISEEPTIVAGDFNNNFLWDKPGHPGNFLNVADELLRLGLGSSYHQLGNHKYGEEPEATLYWRMSTTQVYHIDYCFIPNDWFRQRLEVILGRPEQWLRFSDHVPLLLEVDM
jgi:hypothetical protein